jgi:hypothetical protein
MLSQTLGDLLKKTTEVTVVNEVQSLSFSPNTGKIIG